MDAGPSLVREAGGILGREWVDALALAPEANLSPLDLLRADPLLRDTLVEVINRAMDFSEQRMKHQAYLIIEELGKAMS